MWSAKPPRMPKIRTRLESYVVRNTADIVDDLSDERREELAEVLHDLEGHSPRAEEAERLTEDLVEKLEHRNIVIAKSRARIEELESELAKARAEAGDREERITDQIEVERIRTAEHEQAFRSELEGREAEIKRRLEAFDLREQELRHQTVSSPTASGACCNAKPPSSTPRTSLRPRSKPSSVEQSRQPSSSAVPPSGQTHSPSRNRSSSWKPKSRSSHPLRPPEPEHELEHLRNDEAADIARFRPRFRSRP